MEKLSILLKQPEYVHAALNHFPLIGLLIAMLSLGIALLFRNRPGTLAGLALVGLLALSVWPVYHYGEGGYDRVLSMADDDGRAFLRRHQELAERWVFAYYATAGVAGVGFLLAWKWPKSLPFSSGLALVLAGASVAAGIFIAQVGGEIRHREFRTGPPPAESQEQ
jgi:hypothetical protein